MSKKSLKTVILKQLEKMKSLEFLLLVLGLLGWCLALLEPAVRGKFIEIVGAYVQEYNGAFRNLHRRNPVFHEL